MSEVMKKAEFAKKFGDLCQQFGIGGVESMEYGVDKWGDEFVNVSFEGGGTRKVNVTGDSFGAMIVDIMPRVM